MNRTWACGNPMAAAGHLTFVDNGVTYRARFRSRNAAGFSPWLFVAGIPGTPSGTPPAPTLLEVTPGNARLDLSWAASGRATGRQVQYTSAPTSGNGAVTNSAAVQTGASPSASVASGGAITGLTNDTEYRVRVRFSHGGGDSAWTFGTGTPAASSSNASLRGLVAHGATGSGSSFWPLALAETFDAGPASYTAAVGHWVTHLTLTPQVAAAARTAMLGVRKGSTGDFTPVENGAAIPLDVGANALTVRVTAEDGTTKDYTVTVTRAASDGTATTALVSNFAQTINGRNSFEKRTLAGPFTTGSNAAGYLLRSVEADIAVSGLLRTSDSCA